MWTQGSLPMITIAQELLHAIPPPPPENCSAIEFLRRLGWIHPRRSRGREWRRRMFLRTGYSPSLVLRGWDGYCTESVKVVAFGSPIGFLSTSSSATVFVDILSIYSFTILFAELWYYFKVCGRDALRKSQFGGISHLLCFSRNNWIVSGVDFVISSSSFPFLDPGWGTKNTVSRSGTAESEK